MIELALLEQNTEVLQDRRHAAGRCRRLLEALDNLSRAQNPTGRVGCDLRRLAKVARLEELLVLLDVEVVGTGQVPTRRELERELGVVERGEDVRDQRLIVDADGQDLALAVHAENAVRGLVVGRGEDRLAGDAVHVDAGARFEVVQVDETVLGREIDDAVLLGDLHGDREVVGCLGRKVDIDSLLRERRVGRLVINLDDVKLYSDISIQY